MIILTSTAGSQGEWKDCGIGTKRMSDSGDKGVGEINEKDVEKRRRKCEKKATY